MDMEKLAAEAAVAAVKELVQAGVTGGVAGVGKLWGWIRGKAPEGDAETVRKVEGDPGKASATANVTGLVMDILDDKPELQAELQRLLAEARGAAPVVQEATQTGDGNVANQLAGDGNSVTVQR
ncbi:MAG: hypothetical protein U1E40_12820 [Amaricoccus sp.]